MTSPTNQLKAEGKVKHTYYGFCLRPGLLAQHLPELFQLSLEHVK